VFIFRIIATVLPYLVGKIKQYLYLIPTKLEKPIGCRRVMDTETVNVLQYSVEWTQKLSTVEQCNFRYEN